MRALLWLLCATACCSSSAEQQKPQVTRTALHVARSLDPAAMETMTVRTRTGDVATLLVKKREGRHETATPHSTDSKSSTSNKKEDTVFEKISVGTPYSSKSSPTAILETKSPDLTDQKKNEVDHQLTNDNDNVVSNATRSSKSSQQLVPDPVYVRSSPMLIKGHSQYGHLFSAKRGRSLLKIDADGIPVVTGVRMPDDESDRQVWRNARVINGVLMPYDKNQPKHTFNLQSQAQPYPDKKKIYSAQQSQASWVKMEPITKPTATVLKPVVNEQVAAPIVQEGSWSQVSQNREDPLTIVAAPVAQEWQQYPKDVVKVIDDTQPNLPEEDKYLRDRILDYIKSVNKQEVKRLPALGPYRDSRGLVLDEVPVPPVEGEARMLFRVAEPSEALPMEGRMSQGSAEASSDVLPMEARMLQVPGASVYPTSMLYSPPGSPEATRVGSPVEEGVRTPVLQYAHPELGVQPAVPEVESRLRGADDVDEHPGMLVEGDGGREQALAYFSHDIHADRSPFAFEPGLEDEARVAVDRQQSQRSHGPNLSVHRPKKIEPPHRINSHQFYVSERPASDPNMKYYGKLPDVPVYSLDHRDRPFWERIGDTIREHVQTGVDKMTEMTRPVMEPLVEATHKISHNLGLGTDREMNSFKEKLGVVGTPSVFLPALGLVAGGAALGLGAVAVGRYLDVDMLKRSGAGDAEIEQLQLEHKRAMEALDKAQATAQVTGRGHDLDRAAHAQFSTQPLHPSASPEDVSKPAETSDSKPSTSRRRRRRHVLSGLQHLDHQEEDQKSSLLRAGLGEASLWADTPCAKRTFCQVMLSQPGDDVFLMEKKMAAFLAMLPPTSRTALGNHLDDVMMAVKNRDCSAFLCRYGIKEIPVPR